MGWTFPYTTNTRKDLLAHLRRPERYGPNQTLLKSTAIGNNHWYLCKNNASGTIWIGLDKMQGGTPCEPGWGYKDMDETMGPVEVNCPLSFLDKASAPTGYGIEWREKVREFHAKKNARPEPKPGMVVKFGDHEYKLNHPVGPRKGWSVTRVSDGRGFRMSANYMGRALYAVVSS